MSSSCSLCPAKQFLASLGLPPSTVESVSHFITPEESSEHQPSWALKGDSNLKCSCARQTPLDSRLPINAWAESIFAIIKHLHSVIMQAAVDEGELIVRECRIWEYFARGDFDRLCKTMSQLVNHCIKTILISHLDQTFTMSYIQTTVDCLCKEEYVLPPLAGAHNEVSSDQRERNDARRALRLHSQQALLLLKLLHAVTSATCVISDKETVEEGHRPSPTPVWLSCSWQSCSRNLLILENHEGGLRDDAISLRPAPKNAAPPPAPVSRSVSSATKKKRRVLLDSIDGGKVTTSDHPGEPATAKRPRRGRGIPRVPPEVQLIILSFLPPRHIVTADATCHTWKYLIESDCNTRQAMNSSRLVRNVFYSFLTDDWGEKYLSLNSWSNLVDFEVAEINAAISAAAASVQQQQEQQDALDAATTQRMKEFIQLSLNIADRRVSLWVRYSRTVLVAQKRDPQGRTAPIARALRADPSCSWVVKALNYVFRQAQRIFERNVRKLRQSVPIDNAPLYQTHVLNRDFASLTALHSEANERIGEAERP